jgi:Na+-transporting methylmalonyl-CoA/oxaloacetate decarboxylase gamma subunit
MILNNLNFDAIDTDALILTIVGYLIVFSALVLLYFVFFNLPKLLNLKFKKKKTESGEPIVEETIELSGEVNAAISMALYLYFNQYHDEESNEMTIVRESRIYSPWSSKIYQVRNQFNRL